MSRSASNSKALRAIVLNLHAGRRLLDASAAHYVCRVHRLGVGDEFVAVDPHRGQEAMVRLESVTGDQVTCQVEAPRAAADQEVDELSLFVALTKGAKLERVLDAACQLGVSEIVVVSSERSVVRLEQERAESRRVRWVKVLEQAARQSGRARLPALRGPLPLGQALGQALTREGAQDSAAFVLDPAAHDDLGGLLGQSAAGAVRLLVGPEGGFTDPELELARSHGFIPGRFGRLTLRAETAAVAALGAALAVQSSRRPTCAPRE